MAHDRGKREWTKYRMPERFICGLICAEVQIHSCKTNIVATYSSRTCSPTCSAGGGSTHVKRREFTKKKKERKKTERERERRKRRNNTLGWFIIPDRLFDEFKRNVLRYRGRVAIGIETNAGERQCFILRHILTEA